MALAFGCKRGMLCLGAVLAFAMLAGCGDEGDIIAPRFTIDAVATPTNQTPLTLSGTVEEGSVVEVSVTPELVPAGENVCGEGEAASAGRWSCTLTFPDSQAIRYTVSFSAADERGNRSTASLGVDFDNQPPRVAAFGPTGESPSADIFVLFDEPMSKEALEAPGAMTITSGDGIEVAGSVLYDEATMRATFVSEEPLAPGDYTMALDGSAIQDLAGNPLGEDFMAVVVMASITSEL